MTDGGAREALLHLDELEHFLDGSDHYEGRWIFNEPSGTEGRYWWRSELLHPVFGVIRAARASQPAATEEKDGD